MYARAVIVPEITFTMNEFSRSKVVNIPAATNIALNNLTISSFHIIRIVFFFLLLVANHSDSANFPSQDSAVIKLIDETNRKIDRAVVAKDLKFLDQHYGEDFVFTHATGFGQVQKKVGLNP